MALMPLKDPSTKNPDFETQKVQARPFHPDSQWFPQSATGRNFPILVLSTQTKPKPRRPQQKLRHCHLPGGSDDSIPATDLAVLLIARKCAQAIEGANSTRPPAMAASRLSGHGASRVLPGWEAGERHCDFAPAHCAGLVAIPSHSERWVEPLQFHARIGGGELPVGLGVVVVAGFSQASTSSVRPACRGCGGRGTGGTER